MTDQQPLGPRVGLGLLAAAAAVVTGVSLWVRRARADAINDNEGFAIDTAPPPLGEMTLVQHEPPTDGSRWSPYTHDGQFRDDWWDRNFPIESRFSLWSAYLGETEAVRIQLNRWFDYSGYPRVPQLGYATMGIEYIETADHLKGKYGCGGMALGLLAKIYADHRFLAETHDAPTYWGRKLGWAPYNSHHIHRAGWTLFVAPAGWPHTRASD